MKLTTSLLVVSLAANVALAGWWLRPALTDSAAAPPAAASAFASTPPPPPPATPPAEATAAASSRPDAATVRDRLRALGFPEAMVRAAVRAMLEAPRLARERAARSAAPARPWWQPGFAADTSSLRPPREFRELRQAEREELTRLLGPTGTLTAAEFERYAHLPEEKAAQLALLERDYAELKRELPTGPDAPTTTAGSLERERLLRAEHERDLAALLTPEEREEHALRTSIAAHSVGLNARYFSATEAEYRAIYKLQKVYYDATDPTGVLPGRLTLGDSQRLWRDLESTLGPDRFAAYQRAQHRDHTALVELQRRFPIPVATAAAVAAIPYELSAAARSIVDDRARSPGEKAIALRDLADDARRRLRATLGDDLGGAYIAAASRGWLDYLDQGMAPFFQPNGQRALHMVDPRRRFGTRTPPAKQEPAQKSPSP